MKNVKNLQELIAYREEFPEYGFFYVSATADIESAEGLQATEFLWAENEEEEISLENNTKTFSHWLEIPTLLSIIENVEEYIKTPSLNDFTEAILYYWEYDDFLDYEEN